MEEQKVPLVTVSELARTAGVTVGNLRQLLGRGTLSGYKVGGTIWVIPREEAERYLARREGRARASFRNKSHQS